MFPNDKNNIAFGLDIGSNSFSLTKMIFKDGHFCVLDDASLPVRLLEDFKFETRLKHIAMVRGFRTLEKLDLRFDLKNMPVKAYATAALRMVCNADDFIIPAEKIIGTKIEIISGETEALMVAKGATLDINVSNTYTIVDTGGQSTEFCFKDENGSLHPISLPIGAVGLTTKYPYNTEPSKMKDLENRVALELKKLTFTPAGPLIAVSGTIVTLARIILGNNAYSRSDIHGLVVHKNKLDEIFNAMLPLSPNERVRKYKISPGRADIFPAGIAVVREVLKFTGNDSFTVSVNGLRTGAAISLLFPEK